MGSKNIPMPTNYQSVNNLKVSEELLSFINNELFEEIEIDPKEFWIKFDKMVHELAPINKDLIKEREDLQKKLIIGILKIRETK